MAINKSDTSINVNSGQCRLSSFRFWLDKRTDFSIRILAQPLLACWCIGRRLRPQFGDQPQNLVKHLPGSCSKGKKRGSQKLKARGNIADVLQRHGQRRIKSLRLTGLARPAKRLPRKWGSASLTSCGLAKMPRKHQVHRRSLEPGHVRKSAHDRGRQSPVRSWRQSE